MTPSARSRVSPTPTSAGSLAYETDTQSREPSTGCLVKPAPGLELDAAVRQRADADLRAREVLPDRHGHVELFVERPDPCEDGRMLRRLTVREIEPGHVHPALEESPALRPG
jgi:hypothetical protein